MQNDHYAHKIKEIMSFNKDDYEILQYFNFYILLVDIHAYYYDTIARSRARFIFEGDVCRLLGLNLLINYISVLI